MNTHIPKSFQNRIVQALRKLSFSWPPRNAAKAERKVAPATYKCDYCDTWIYEGANLDKLLKKRPKLNSELIVESKIVMDHEEEVVEVGEHRDDWNVYVNRMFAPQESWNCLCKICDSWKLLDEKERRKEAK